MATSGRDRDPAFRRRKVVAKPAAGEVKKPVSNTEKKEIPPVTPVEAKKETPVPPSQPTPSTPLKANVSPSVGSLTTPALEPQKKVQPALVYEDDSDKTKTVVPPVVVKNTAKPTTKKEETKPSSGGTPPPKKPKTTSTESSPNKGAKKRRILGVFMAIIFIVGFGVIGFYMVNNIMNTEKNKINNTASGAENTKNEEGEAHAGAVSMDDNEASEGDEMRETTLNEENSLEGEMTGFGSESSSEETTATEENTEAQEKQALSKVIRKKGDFEIPCWIVAFSANSDKPLANMNYSSLEALGFDAGIYWIPKYFSGGKSLYKVYVGPYKSPEQAQAILPQIKNLQPDAYVMKIDE